MVIGPAVWIVAVFLVLVVACACIATYLLCRRMLSRELAAMRRLLEARPAAAVNLDAEAMAKQACGAAASTTPVTIRIRKRTPGAVPADDAAVIAAGSLALVHERAGLDIRPVEVPAQPGRLPGNGSWVQQGRALVHAARNVAYRPAPQAALFIVGRGNGTGEGKGEAAD